MQAEEVQGGERLDAQNPRTREAAAGQPGSPTHASHRSGAPGAAANHARHHCSDRSYSAGGRERHRPPQASSSPLLPSTLSPASFGGTVPQHRNAAINSAIMSAPGPLEVASTIQTASIQRDPSPHHDVNPSTAASTREPVHVHPASSDIDDDEIPLSVLHPAPRRPQHHLPPLPDLRFEQSYLKSIEKCNSSWGVAYITLRDQVLLPLLQGTLWTLVLSGWRYWNRASQLSGQSVGARVRRWWWGVNNWKLPSLDRHDVAEKVKDVSIQFMRVCVLVDCLCSRRCNRANQKARCDSTIQPSLPMPGPTRGR